MAEQAAQAGTTITSGGVEQAVVPRVGRDAGPFGRLVRLISGGLLVAASVETLLGAGRGYAAEAGGFLLGLVVFYLVLYRLLDTRALARLDPFVATVLVLGPLFVFELSLLPRALHTAVGVYVGVGLLINAAIRYGGCEVVALSTVLTGRRKTVYCPWNFIDAAERPLHRTRSPHGWATAVSALVIVGYFYVAYPLLERLGVPNPVSPYWALLLLVPAAVLALRAWAHRTRDASTAWSLALSAAALTALALTIPGLVRQDIIFAAVILAGLVTAAIRLLVRSWRHPATGTHEPTVPTQARKVDH